MKIHRTLLAVAIVGLIAGITLTSGCSDNSTNPPAGGGGTTFNSGDLTTAGQVFVFTFPTAGSFNYRCIHHASMTGTVNVTPTGADSPQVLVGSGSFVFSPDPVDVKAGSYVKWVYAGTVPHTVTRP